MRAWKCWQERGSGLVEDGAKATWWFTLRKECSFGKVRGRYCWEGNRLYLVTVRFLRKVCWGVNVTVTICLGWSPTFSNLGEFLYFPELQSSFCGNGTTASCSNDVHLKNLSSPHSVTFQHLKELPKNASLIFGQRIRILIYITYISVYF